MKNNSNPLHYILFPKPKVAATLTPDQKKLGIDLIYLDVEVVRHIVGKLLTRTITLLQTASQSEVCS
jgi:hypothetical protein